MQMEFRAIIDKLNKIRLLLLDVDGVLTDGSIIYDDTGSQIKVFNAKDGLGIRLLMLAGVIFWFRKPMALQPNMR